MNESEYRAQSFWLDSVPGSLVPRPSLDRGRKVDVAIVGAGYTGLWTAYYLARARPELAIAIVESEIAGFGASGRNGGWCGPWIAGFDPPYADLRSAKRYRSLELAAMDAVDEVGRVCMREGIDAHFAKGGCLRLATSPGQYRRIECEYVESQERAAEPDELQWLDRAACERRIGCAPVFGGLFMPDCAVLHPARLVRGLAEVVERAGVAIYEQTPARALLPGVVETARGRLRADVVVRATEAYTACLDGHSRRYVPLHSLMIVTEPLADELWEQIGLHGRESFQDARRLVTYGQRTADGRIAFGGFGGYYGGRKVRSSFSPDEPGVAEVRRSLVALLPALEKVRITHAHGGAIAVARDWCASLGFDRSTGLAFAGGYAGEGVAAANLAGQTLADLITERETERTGLAWVEHRSPRWEPEPLRSLGVRAVCSAAASADRREFAGLPPTRTQRLLTRWIR